MIISSRSPANLFAAEHYAEVRRPLLEASTLPPWCYTAEEFYTREVERIFRRCWHFVGREDELPHSGDYLTFDGHGGPLLVIRGDDGQVRGFYNVCRHRGTRLLREHGSTRRIVCPYHSWVYDTQGCLERASGMESVVGFDHGEHALTPVQTQSWAGFVFINYDHHAPPLSESLGNMPAFFSAYRPQELRVVRRFHFSIACNWKLVLENALEAYHTGTVHKDSLGLQHSRPVDTDGEWDALFVYVDGHKGISVLPGAHSPLPQIEGLTEDQTRGTYFTDIYPCTQFVFARDCMWWMAFQPIGVDRTRLILGACFPETTTQLPQFDAAVKHYYERWETATAEDNAISEEQQVGQRAGARNPGRFSSQETLVHRLSNWVLDQVLD